MRESESSGSVLERYEVPAMRVVPMESGRIVSESTVSFIGDTSQLGVFDNTGGGYNWNVGSVEGGLSGLGLFEEDDAGSFWNVGSVDGSLGGFTDGVNTFLNAASTPVGGLVGFDPVAGQEWNGGTASNSGVGRFESDSGAALQWSDTP